MVSSDLSKVRDSTLLLPFVTSFHLIRAGLQETILGEPFCVLFSEPLLFV